MNGFLHKTGIIDLFPDLSPMIEKYPDLEDLYSNLYNQQSMNLLCKKFNKAIFDYLSALITPHDINIYDKLILSLTNHDCIATFNWDSFLSQSYYYMLYLTNDLPYIIFLHGNVRIVISH